MNKVTKETHLQLLLIILLLAAVILMTQLPFNRKTKTVVAKPKEVLQSYVAKPMSQVAKDIKAKLVKTDKYGGDLKIVDEPEFLVDYNIPTDKFLVNIKTAPYLDSKNKAQEWFMKQGFVDFDLCTLNITFVPVKEIGANLTNADLVFDRCPVPDPVDQSSQATESAK